MATKVRSVKQVDAAIVKTNDKIAQLKEQITGLQAVSKDLAEEKKAAAKVEKEKAAAQAAKAKAVKPTAKKAPAKKDSAT